MADEGEQTEAERLTKALSLAYAHVNRRERTVAEVQLHLEKKGVSDATAAAAVQELVDAHLVDDERYAAMFVADKRNLEQWGSERIRRGLSERGLSRDLIERALAETLPDSLPGSSAGTAQGENEGGSELGRALELLRRRFPDPPRERRDRDRALGMLLRKGYESELAVDALAAHARDAA